MSIRFPILREAGNVKAAEGDKSLTVESYFPNWIFSARYDYANLILAELSVR